MGSAFMNTITVELPDSESVNRALRALIAIAPKEPVENMT